MLCSKRTVYSLIDFVSMTDLYEFYQYESLAIGNSYTHIFKFVVPAIIT